MKIIAESSNPNVKTHAFGVGVKSVLEHIDVYSTDATSWVKRAAYGMISVNDKTIYISDVQKEALKGNHYSERSAAFQYEVEKTIHDRGFRVDPEVSTYTVNNNVATFNAEEGTLTAVLDNDGTMITIGDVKYKLDSVVEYDDGISNDSFMGNWESDDNKRLSFDGRGTVKYDNGTCLSTNCYARARFNIIDTEMWMDKIRKSKVRTVAMKLDLGW